MNITSDIVVLAVLWTVGDYRLEVTPMAARACEREWRAMQHRTDVISECMPMSWWIEKERLREKHR
jgi:hypothetical protein